MIILLYAAKNLPHEFEHVSYFGHTCAASHAAENRQARGQPSSNTEKRDDQVAIRKRDDAAGVKRTAINTVTVDGHIGEAVFRCGWTGESGKNDGYESTSKSSHWAT